MQARVRDEAVAARIAGARGIKGQRAFGRRALSGAALVASLGVILWAMVTGVSRQVAEEEAAAGARAARISELVRMDAYPIREEESLDACGRAGKGVGACVLAEEAMRGKGADAWLAASAAGRRACLERALGAPEPAAGLYVCLGSGNWKD